MKSVVAILVFFALGQSALAQTAEPVRVPTDRRANYSIIVQDVGHGRSALMVISRRIGPSGTSFAIREVNCVDQTFRYMADGDSLDEALENIDDTQRMSDLVTGSISYYIVQAACR